MNKRTTHTFPGAGRKPPVLPGRDPDLEHMQALIERLSAGGHEHSPIYSGLRGVGKAVLWGAKTLFIPRDHADLQAKSSANGPHG